MAALVTGAGYLGAALASRLLARGERVVALENGYCTPLAALATLAASPGCPGFRLIEGDVAEPAAVERAFREAAALALAGDEPLVVYHLAAQPSAGVAAQDPEYTERTNLVGSRVVLQAAAEHGATVVYGSSFRVYGDDLVGQTVDERTAYGRMTDLSHLSKLYVEQLGRMLGGQFVGVRLGVVYGLGAVMKIEPRFMTVPNVFCLRAAHGEVLEIYEDRPIAFIHLHDAVDALLLAAGAASPEAPWQLVNAAPEVLSIGEVALCVQRVAQSRQRFVRVQGAVSDPGTFRVKSRLGEAGFVPARSMAESLGEVFDFFTSRPA